MPDVHRGIISDWGGVLTGPLPETIDAWLAADRIDRERYAAVMAEGFAGIGDTRGLGDAIHALERGEVSVPEFEPALAAELRLGDGAPQPPARLSERMCSACHACREL